MRYFIRYIRHMADFKGRANRREFWNAQLLSVLFGLVFTLVSRAAREEYSGSLSGGADRLIAGAVLLYYVIIAVSSLALSVRRMHDIGIGKQYLPAAALFLPIMYIPLAIVKGDAGPNIYGDPPDPFPLGG
jgi:uncharacterized membrane protein YhaH (DUF805 family)